MVRQSSCLKACSVCLRDWEDLLLGFPRHPYFDHKRHGKSVDNLRSCPVGWSRTSRLVKVAAAQIPQMPQGPVLRSFKQFHESRKGLSRLYFQASSAHAIGAQPRRWFAKCHYCLSKGIFTSQVIIGATLVLGRLSFNCRTSASSASLVPVGVTAKTLP